MDGVGCDNIALGDLYVTG